MVSSAVPLRAAACRRRSGAGGVVADREPRETVMLNAARMSPGVLLGIGLGGFLDGIVLHQIGQWHNMGSARLPPLTMAAMSRNMAWDGWFHLATWLITLLGVLLLWRSG